MVNGFVLAIFIKQLIAWAIRLTATLNTCNFKKGIGIQSEKSMQISQVVWKKVEHTAQKLLENSKAFAIPILTAILSTINQMQSEQGQQLANALLFSLLIPIPFLKIANFICYCIFENAFRFNLRLCNLKLLKPGVHLVS